MKTLRSGFASRATQTLVLGIAALSAAIALVVACGDDPDARPPFDEVDAGEARDGQANLPDAGELSDVSSPKPDAKEPYSSADEEVVCSDAGPCAKELVAGRNHFCARMADGTVRCWGDAQFGQLGRPPPKAGSDDSDAGDAGAIALPVDGLTGVTQISSAGDTTCARLEQGGVRCWGSNQNGELGVTVDPPTSDWERHPVPVAPEGVENVTRVDVGHAAVCAVLGSGKLACWGRNAAGQLARPIDGNPVGGPGEAPIDPLAVKAVRGSQHTMLGLAESGELWVWGAISGNEGVSSGVIAALSPSVAPRKIESLSNVTSFAISIHFQVLPPRPRPGEPRPEPPPPQAHACAIMNGDVYCWGRSDKAALCTGLPDPEKLPRIAPVDSKAWPQRLAVGHEITCVRMTDGTVQCCGGNEKGRLGMPATTTHSASFAPVSTLVGHAVQVVTSNASVCALLADGTVQCWGANFSRELGTTEPDEDAHPEPHPIAF